MTASETVAALQSALAAEHVAIYGYSVIGARLQGPYQEKARRLWDAHRSRRDRLRTLIVEHSAQPTAAASAYRLPGTVSSPRAAFQIAATLEDGVTSAYLGLVGVDDPNLRRYAALAMQEAIVRALRWRGGPVTSAFPGMTPAALQPAPED